MVFGTHQRLKSSPDSRVVLDGNEIQRVYEYKYLGLLFDPTLSWEKHAEVMCNKISKRLGVLRKVRDYLDRKTAHMLYNALVLPLFDYCDIVLGQGNSGILTRLQRLQNRGGRIILGWRRFTHTQDILNELKWLSVKERVMLHTGIMMYKCYTKDCPRYLYDSIQYAQARPSCNTRASMLQQPVPSSHKLSTGQRCFTYHGPKFVDKLDFRLSDCETLGQFKGNTTRYLVNNRL